MSGTTRRGLVFEGLVFGLAGTAALTACSSPSPTLYTLAVVPGPNLTGGPRTVVLRAIGLARYLERPQIVRSTESYLLEMEANEWWGEPLGAMLSRILVEELAQRLPGSVVLAETGAIGITPDAIVEINILRLDADRTGVIVLRAQVGVSNPSSRRPPVARAVEVKTTPASGDTIGAVAAMSEAVGQFADQIAAMLIGR